MIGRRWRVGLWCLVLTFLAAPAAASTVSDGDAVILRVRLDGPVTPVSANALIDAVDEAEERGASAVLVEINTPGGLVTSMREVVERFLAAQVPVITYVAPNGARAASAGALITLSGNVAAMAPSTTIGAATPVTLDGEAVGDKVVNDTASFAQAVAQARDRDITFAREAVEQGTSIVATEALERGAIDEVAPNYQTLLQQIDGGAVTLGDGTSVALEVWPARVEDVQPGTVSSLLSWIVDPNITFVLLALGTLSLLVEFANPGIGAGGITGVILLLLAGFSLSLLPTTLVGLALLLLAAALFVGELFVPGTGVMAAGGSIALVIAGIFLFDGRSGLTISQPLLFGVAAVVLIGSTALAVAVRNAQAMPYRLDDEQMLDQIVEVAVAHNDQGQAMINGERWHIRTDEPPLQRGMRVRILERKGLTLLVEPTDDRLTR